MESRRAVADGHDMAALNPTSRPELTALLRRIARRLLSSGNRVAAAAALGLARSSLYRKIHQYGITL